MTRQSTVIAFQCEGFYFCTRIKGCRQLTAFFDPTFCIEFLNITKIILIIKTFFSFKSKRNRYLTSDKCFFKFKLRKNDNSNKYKQIGTFLCSIPFGWIYITSLFLSNKIWSVTNLVVFRQSLSLTVMCYLVDLQNKPTGIKWVIMKLEFSWNTENSLLCWF